MAGHALGAGGTTWMPDARGKLSATPMFYSRSHDAVIRVYDAAGNMIDTH